MFFAVAHDPTQLNRQGPDEGPQYRSAIFFNSPEQKAVAEAYIRQLNDAKIFPRRIVTTVSTLDGFYPAEPEHQDFITPKPVEPVRSRPRRPKLEHLEKEFPDCSNVNDRRFEPMISTVGSGLGSRKIFESNCSEICRAKAEPEPDTIPSVGVPF